MRNKKLSLITILILLTISCVVFSSCNDNTDTKKTVLIDSTNMKKSKRVLDTTAESRPLLPGGKTTP